jgi:hypothetical protein
VERRVPSLDPERKPAEGPKIKRISPLEMILFIYESRVYQALPGRKKKKNSTEGS